MWRYTEDSKYQYRLDVTGGGYTLLVTDMQSVWCECLTFSQITERGIDLEFALDTKAQILKFCPILASFLSTKQAKFSIPLVSVRSIDYNPSLKWEFHLVQVTDNDASKVFSSMATEFLIAVKNMGTAIRSKNLVIKGLNDAVSRKVPYRPPKNLEKHFNVNSSQKNSLEWVALYGAESRPIDLVPAQYEETIDVGESTL